jgi:hypothetical protein
MTMPTTRKTLCAYINKTLCDLLDDAKDNEDQYSDITFTIKGDGEFIHGYIKDMCDKYNEKNDIWKCCVEDDDHPEYTLKVCHVDDYGDCFDWILDDDDTPLCDADA